MDHAFYSIGESDEGTELGEGGDGAGDGRAGGELRRGFDPWVAKGLLEAERDTLRGGVDAEDHDFDYVANVTRLNAATLATLAAAPGVPQDVRILTAELDNNTELTWQPPVGAPSGTTYEVVWRPTDQPLWTTSASAGSALALKLAVSKDNVVFGVRSVDPAGHRSIAVLPTPMRSSPKPATLH